MHINYDNGTMFWETILKIALCLIKFGEYQNLLSFINHFNLFIKREKISVNWPFEESSYSYHSCFIQDVISIIYINYHLNQSNQFCSL